MIEILDTYTDLIKRHAYVALKKVKKPSDYEVEDFIQEGVIVFLYTKKAFKEDRGCSFESFLTRCLRQHFGGLVSQSYRGKKITNLKLKDRGLHRTPKILPDVFDIISMRHVINDFTADELEYVETILSFVGTPVKFRRKLTRKALNISYERERELRNSIHDKIRK